MFLINFSLGGDSNSFLDFVVGSEIAFPQPCYRTQMMRYR